MSPSTLPLSKRRDPWLDTVRGASVVAMVLGHTLDLTLEDRVRDLPLVALYWSFRGLTAPLFLVVAGWALASSLRSTDADTVGRRLRRAALALALGYGLHWPGLSAAQTMAAEGTLWPHLLAFDALPCIGWSIAAGVLLLSLLPRTPGRIGALGVLALWIPFVATVSWPVGLGAGWLWRGFLGHPEAHFPLVPWSAFFFLGGALALLVPTLRERRHRAMALLLAGGLLLLMLEQTGLEDWSLSSPWPAFYRMGQALLALGFFSALPVSRIPGLVSLGRRSLGVYVGHLVLLYGWAGDEGLVTRWTHQLSFPEAFALAAAVLAAATAMAQGVPAALRWLEERAAPRWQQPSGEPG
ncbi:MAG TPA: acyltransferase family protein [Myxococcaceae bacterium]|nr:acyltransferase family protein [Myxococcaceae bacterium]